MVFIKEKKSPFIKHLSFFDVLMLSLGSSLGTGIFVLLGLGTEIASYGFFFSFIIATFICLIVALNYAELSSSMTITGGPYSFVKESLGGITAFYVGWLLWLGFLVYAALSAVAFMNYINYFIPIPVKDIPAIILVLFFTFINMKGIKKAKLVQNVMTLMLLGIFLIYIIAGFSNLRNKEIQFFDGISSIFAATTLAFTCFLGFDSITFVAEEVKKPRNIILALVLAVLIPGTIYSLTTLVTLNSVSHEKLINSSVPLFEMVKFNPYLLFLTLLAAIFATLSSLNISLVVASRNAFALSRDGYMPKSLSLLSEKTKTPNLALLFSSLFVIFFIATRGIEFMANVACFGYIIAFSLVSISLIILRKKRKFLPRPFKVPFYEFFAFLGFILPLILLFFLESKALFVGAVWMVIGFFVYCLHTLGVDRFRYAFAGINVLIGILSLSFWYSLELGFPKVSFPAKIFLSCMSLIIWAICFIAAVLFMKKLRFETEEEKSRKS